MLKGLVILAFVAVCAHAQENATQPVPVPAMDMAVMQASGELMMAQKYLGVILKFQHAMYSQQAASMYLQILMLNHKLDGDDNRPVGYILEEDEEEAMSEDDIRDMIAKSDLYGGYFLMYANKIRLFQVIYQAGELQNEYFQDRAMQLSLQATGGTAPPQFMQLMYLKIFATYMKTVKLSYALQTINSFTTWLEDELDVNTAIVSGSPDAELLLSTDELITDKEFAFHAYSSYATIDYQLFFIDLYWEYSLMSMMAPPAAANNNAAAASFLEVEAEAEPAKPFVSAYLAYSHPWWFTKIYKYYFLMYQMQAAQSGFQSAFAERQSWNLEDDGLDSEEQRDKLDKMAVFSFNGGFASSLLQASHIQYITAMFDVYGLYAGMGQQPQQAAH